MEDGLPCPSAADVFRENCPEHESCQRKNGNRVIVAIPKRKEYCSCNNACRKRYGEIPSQTFDACTPPCDDRSYAGEKEQENSQWTINFVKKRRTHGDLDAAHPFRKDRENRAPERGES